MKKSMAVSVMRCDNPAKNILSMIFTTIIDNFSIMNQKFQSSY